MRIVFIKIPKKNYSHYFNFNGITYKCPATSAEEESCLFGIWLTSTVVILQGGTILLAGY